VREKKKGALAVVCCSARLQCWHEPDLPIVETAVRSRDIVAPNGARAPASIEGNQKPGFSDRYNETFRRRTHMGKALAKSGIAAAATILMIAGSTAALPSVAYAQYYHHHGGYGWGGFAAGAAAGALLGGMLAAPYYAPGPAPGYYEADAVRYCMQRFKSYDPASGTYLGHDGYRHPCP
jgi:hypothetical protein